MKDMKDLKELMMMMEDKMEGDDSPMSSEREQAKMDVLKELIQMADEQESMGIKDGLQKVTVAAPDQESLVEGLDKAEDIVENMPEMMEGMMEDDDDEDEEDDEEDM